MKQKNLFANKVQKKRNSIGEKRIQIGSQRILFILTEST